VLVGRAREQGLLDDLVRETRAGRGGVVGLVGDAGIGKSALLDDLAARTEGLQVLRIHAVQSEARLPFAALFELLRPLLDLLPTVPAPQRDALEGALALRAGRSEDRFAIGAGTLALLSAAADRAPLLVLVDDAQWLDGSTADALRFAGRRLLADPVGTVVAARPDGRPFVDDLRGTVVELPGLDRAATAELLRDCTRDAVLLDHLHAGTGGNPLALRELDLQADELLRAPPSMPVPVGPRITAVYAARWAQLPEGVQDVVLLLAASDAGDLADLGRAASRAGLDLRLLDDAAAAGLVVVRSDRAAFCHPLVRSAVYRAAAPDRRRAAHRLLAATLPDADADRRAWHLAVAAVGPDDTAASAMAQAGDRAWQRSAYDSAWRALERAASLTGDAERRSALLARAAEAAWLSGSPNGALAVAQAARAAGPSGRTAMELEHLLGRVTTRVGPVDDGRRLLVAAADRAADIDVDRAVQLLAEAVNAAFYAADAPAMLDAAGRLGSVAAGATSGHSAFLAALCDGMAKVFAGDGEAGVAQLHAAVALADAGGDDPRRATWEAMAPLWLREAGTGTELVSHAVDLARRRTSLGVLPFLLTHVAIAHGADDRWDQAVADFHEAVDLARESGLRTDLAFALSRLAGIEARRGEDAACIEHASEARALAAELGAGIAELWALVALSDLALVRGRLDETVALLDERRGVVSRHGIGDVDVGPEADLVEVHLRAGRVDAAEAAADALAAAADAKGQPWSLARAARCAGLLAPAGEVEDRFEEALRWHEATPDAFEEARTRLAYGARLRRTRRRVRAREQLRRALSTFDRLGAAPWAEQARAELEASGGRARRRGDDTRTLLTPQELKVAAALASGRTTREAAAALFLSPKTVEHHMRSAYRKLGIGSRAELAAVFDGPEPT